MPNPCGSQHKKRIGNKKRKPFDAHDTASYKAALAQELAERILEAPAELVDEQWGQVRDHPSRYFAGLLLAEAAASNHVVATLEKAPPPGPPPSPKTAGDGLPAVDLVDLMDNRYEQGIPLARMSLRISPAYSQALRRRAHREAESGMRRATDDLETRMHSPNVSEAYGRWRKFDWSYRWVHGVGTMQHPEGAEAWPEAKRINRVFDLFRKRKIFKDNVIATIKGVEGRITPRGAHVHQHNMFLMRRVDLKAWEQAWQECGGGFFRLYTVVPHVNDPDNEQTQDEALSELCKYITKTEDLLDPDPVTGEKVGWQVLVNLCTPARWPRMFEVLGTARKPSCDLESPQDPQGESILSPGRSPGFRFIHREYLTAAPLETPDVETWDEAQDGPEPSKWQYFGREVIPRPPRPPTWRKLMDILDLDKWLEVIAGRIERAQNWRLKQIKARCIGPIIDLDGRIREPRQPEARNEN
jgi:hypothetical protein